MYKIFKLSISIKESKVKTSVLLYIPSTLSVAALIVHYDSLAITIDLLQPQKVWKLFELKNHKTKPLQFQSLQ